MENTKLSLKVQFDDKVKRLLEKEYHSLDELKEVIQNSFKNLRPNSYVLKYLDSDDDWLYIIDDSDIHALKEYSKDKSGKSIKLVIEAQEVLAQSTVEPKRFNQSQVQIQDSCVAEVEAFLKKQAEELPKVEEEPESLKRVDESEMDVEIIENEFTPATEIKESEEVINALREELENARISETQPETNQTIESIEPVIVEEEKNNVDPQEVAVEDEEIIDTSNNNEEMKVDEPQPELKNFNIMECLQNIENALNDTENDFCPKKIVQSIKKSAEGTKAEQNIKKVIKKLKGCKGMFIKKLLKGFLGGCDEKKNKNSGVIHRGITCDGCGARPIIGVRYKCSECQDYDLCQVCEGKELHNHHVFLKLKAPMGVDIIYSHRTDDAPTQPSAEPAPAQEQPRAHPHCPMRGQWGTQHPRAQARPNRPHHGHGHGPRHFQNNPLFQLAQQFLGGFNMEVSEDEQTEEKPKNERKKFWDVRPKITKQPSEPILGASNGMQIIETTIQNQSPWPYRLKSVKMLEADEGIQFVPIETDVLLKRDESQDFCLAVQLPQAAGTYKATFGFFNHHDKNQGEKLTVVFNVVDEEDLYN